MGEADIDAQRGIIIINSHIITYGDAADENVTESMRREIEVMWNEPNGRVDINGLSLLVAFTITATLRPDITKGEIHSNADPRNNYFRIEEYSGIDISSVDGLGSNSGYFKLGNLYEGSTTAAHEYGHTIGLDHPQNLDHRGQGVPGIMFPRGTLVDPQYQYDPSVPPGTVGGTMHPMYRKVLPGDITLLRLDKLRFKNRKAVLGNFTNRYHLRQG